MSIIDLIYPKRCVGCARGGRYICEKCTMGIKRSGESLKYAGVVRKGIKEIKYRGSYAMAQELVDIWNPVRAENPSLVTAVPMWEPKRKKRGFNQAELIGRVLSERWKVEYREMLVRTRDTKPMYGLNREQRKENVMAAFGIIASNQPYMLKQQNVILVDDVWTTGSTMRECANVLYEAGAAQINMMTLAR